MTVIALRTRDGLALCVDGPFNGDYVPVEYGETQGYELRPWTTEDSELVLMWEKNV